MMTYREAIQIQIKGLMDLYDNAGGLRDVASTQQEKEAYNAIRGSLPKLWSNLQNIDNKLSAKEAAYVLQGNYSLKVTPEDI